MHSICKTFRMGTEAETSLIGVLFEGDISDTPNKKNDDSISLKADGVSSHRYCSDHSSNF
jgi:hypothetical protein